MKKQKTTVGFDRKLRFLWLEATAELVAQGLSSSEIRQALDGLLESEVAGTAHNSARGKTKTVLLQTWANVSNDVLPLRDQALVLRQELSTIERIPLHWGMLLATYPFFKQVTDTIGRLSSLQAEFTSAQVQRRVLEIFGERETVRRAVQRAISSILDWGLIDDTGKIGVYRIADPVTIANKNLILWLLKVVISTQESKALDLDAIRSLPSFFPFRIIFPSNYEIEQNLSLDIQQQDQERPRTMNSEELKRQVQRQAY